MIDYIISTVLGLAVMISVMVILYVLVLFSDIALPALMWIFLVLAANNLGTLIRS